MERTKATKRALALMAVALVGVTACSSHDDAKTPKEVIADAAERNPVAMRGYCQTVLSAPAIQLPAVMVAVKAELSEPARQAGLDTDDLANAFMAYCMEKGGK
jgi:hypothetical protein